MPATRSRKVVKLKPALPPPEPGAGFLAQQPIKVLQGQGTRRSDSTHPGHPRTTLFVTRRTKLGALIARAKSLVLDEGATELKLYALGAAISHTFVLLHALMDILPYPIAGPGRAGMWFEIRTGTTECKDEIPGKRSGLNGVEAMDAEGGKEEEDEGGKPGEEDWGDLGFFVEDKAEIQTRNKIVLHISGRKPSTDTKPKKKARPSAKKRKARAGGANASEMDVDPADDEEALMNM
ncbi:hypothetical protein A1Q1_00217 [Trichosporon asahii var. asahii CBS 2479]|uniref:Uncharacterized protein n=1 Tax=Trichosporon asahii var. asahii (strain ATCC 90039 / CBS 2479 / JCM 2466 / KCTC 7840 / NBRC 103889/ NCYC 2677 / UAMH 7654) TaxID=1186058 RepID=J5TE35_TRIAS|nr:hypothetical protein A1Q1_00217 [Trichosporon asahii var. asahii CBS 2479]EJT50476.1 hypothetical protein A1Q1_00217 [Trichosporon asahii var. asahii CBS 2479]